MHFVALQIVIFADFFIVAAPHLIAFFVAILRIDWENVESKTSAVAIFDWAAPKTERPALMVGFDAPLNPVAVVFLTAVNASNNRGNRLAFFG